MKVAIIGCGSIATRAHIPAYMENPEVEIKYFCDIIPERAQEAVQKNGCGIAVTDYRVIVTDPEVEAVSICTPNDMHATISIAMLEAGKHVLCEKPAAINYQRALEMQEAQHKSGKVLNIGVVNRFNTAVNMIKDYITEGKLGEVYHVYVSFRSKRNIPGLGGAFTTKAIAGGGALIDWGVHFLDIVMYCCGDPQPRTVTGEAFSKLGVKMRDYVYEGTMWAGPPNYDGVYDVDDSVTGVVRTDGPVITLHGAWAQNIFENEMYIDFMGTKGGIRLRYGQDFTYYTTEGDKLISVTPPISAVKHYQAEIDAFIRCIHTGEKLPSHIDTNIITARMMQAIYDSSEAHREIVLD